MSTRKFYILNPQRVDVDVGPQYLATRCCGYAAYGEANKTKKLIKGTNEDVRRYHLKLKS